MGDNYATDAYGNDSPCTFFPTHLSSSKPPNPYGTRADAL
ncbi:hypothetical protein VP468E531_P0082 [Vibrio phage 468E53-1]|nr:hypothetical protein VP468E531_P0082 [Vibrio phage 468E53-1]